MSAEDPIWDEIDRLQRGIYDEDKEMAGNSKAANSWLVPLVCSIVSGLIVGLGTRFGGDGAAEGRIQSKQLTAVSVKLEFVAEQVKLLAERPYISRDEFEREFSRLERRINELERAQFTGRRRTGDDP